MREQSMKLEEWKTEHLKKNKDRTKREAEGQCLMEDSKEQTSEQTGCADRGDASDCQIQTASLELGRKKERSILSGPNQRLPSA